MANTNSDLFDEIAELKRQLKELQNSVRNIQPLNPNFSTNSGAPQPWFELKRDDDRSVALRLGDPSPTPTYHQYITLFDGRTTPILSEDQSGFGLSSPILDRPLYLDAATLGGSSSNAAYTRFLGGTVVASHPVYRLVLQYSGPASFYITLDGGVIVGTTNVSGTGTLGFTYSFTDAQPGVSHQIEVWGRSQVANTYCSLAPVASQCVGS